MNTAVIKAIVRKELFGYFASPTAYVFITLFVFLSGIAAFWTDAFFSRNLANLDQLNNFFPALLLFLIPAITMGLWADERKQGTEELLMTLPAKELDLLVGKFLGASAIYTICLLFAASHILVLFALGNPDGGLMLSTYLGYWLAGIALCGIGLAASVVSASATISFVACALSCGVLVAIGTLGDLLPSKGAATGIPWQEILREASIPRRMEAFGRGVIAPADIAYFLGLAALGVYIAKTIVASRRVGRGPGLHLPLRGAAIATIILCTVVLIERGGLRADATAERLWSVSAQTRDLVSKIDPDRPVVMHAYVSPTVPPQLVQTRETLLGLLSELEAAGRGRLQVQITATEPNTEQARDADRSYGIKGRPMVTEDRGGGSVQEIFLGLAVTAGGTEASVIPFFSPGLPVEYELARAIRAAGNESKKKIGVLDTEAGLFAKFDFQTMQPGRDWPIVTELKKQYKVERVAPPTADAKIPADIDVLIVAQPSTMTPDEFAGVLDYIKSGRAAIILEDPMPIVNPAIGSNEQRRPANPMMGGDPRSQQPKADLKPLFELLGARVVTDSVAWDTYNPHPNLAGVPPEFIWLNRTAPWAKTVSPFNETEAITSGLQEVVMLFPGRIERTETKKPAEGSGTVASGPDFTALMRSSPTSGQMPVSSIVQRTMFGTTFNENRKPIRTNTSQVLAALIKGKSGESNVNVILLGDLDMVSETFFNLREQGSGATGGLEFDNVTFILNCVDVLSGDQSLLDLRKKRRTYRTLETLEARRQSEINSAKAAQSTAETEAETKLAEAQARLNAEVKKVQDRQDLDESAKRVMVETVRTAEQRRVDAQTKTIEDQKKQAIEDARLQTRAEIERIQTGIRLAAITLPPVPALAIGLAVMIRRRGREAESARKERAS